MGRNNNNAGMHFMRSSEYGKYDDLSYYNKNSAEGLANKRYNAISELEEMGDYAFTQYVSFIEISCRVGEYDFTKMHRVLVYENEHEKELLRISSKFKLYMLDSYEDNGIEVRVHDKQNVIYIKNNLYEQVKSLIKKDIVYVLK